MKDTRNEILDIANRLIWSVGYNAFSYADISKQLNIKNAAIHYHFPNKADLGVEIIRRNTAAFLKNTKSWADLDCRQQLVNYLSMHDNFIDNHWICIVGSLSPSYDTLPSTMQEELQKLVKTIIDWLSALLSEGQERGVFTFDGTPQARAYLIHSAMLSALLMNKVLKNDVYRSIQNSLLNI